MVRSCNTKYVEECYSITRRLRRGEPYKTNLTTVTKYQWGNNVTYKLILLHSGFPIEIVSVKLCELQNITWVSEYVKLFSNLGSECPYQPGPLGLYNMELPPKNLPQTILNLLKGKTHVRLFIVVTATEETSLKQERATVRSCNYKYVEECHSLTRRLRRGEPYKTNLTAVTKYPWDNNVTYKLVLLHSGFPVEILRVKLCDLPNITWLFDYVKSYSNTAVECPHMPGTYGFYNMELPPKNLPQTILNLLKGKTHVRLFIVVTATEEVIVEYSIILVG
ncbi:hypothetical protein PYW08_002933 [Mythimna loreyi]|uniref:Uncharacterized protein n=1 Tax=Mythimna loreyi TaxID=667449 RepID=A0ACC2QND1_9NEOP|nr:hypothetical protein PYW08_002933 [Mythimna loreyi]